MSVDVVTVRRAFDVLVFSQEMNVRPDMSVETLGLQLITGYPLVSILEMVVLYADREESLIKNADESVKMGVVEFDVMSIDVSVTAATSSA